MASEKKFSHITVTSDDGDDIVIQAGAIPRPDGVSRSEATPRSEAAPRPKAAPQSGVAVQSGAATRAGVALRPAAAVQSDDGKAADKDEYRETTLEDLEVGKMSGMQKGIIAVAVVLIIAFVVYMLV